MNHEYSLIAGWYGKIPSLGDFVSRRLPASFIETWDPWLQHTISANRAQLGEQWKDLYLTAPIWRFILMPGVCSNNIWTGIIMPSVDKVGRYFPLTIAIQIEPRPGVILTAFSAQTWYASLEQLALATLNVNVLPDDLDRGLAKHPFPTPYPNAQNSTAQQLDVRWQTECSTGTTAHNALSVPEVSSQIELFDAAAEDILITTGLGKSIWWRLSSDVEVLQLHSFAGLPPLENNFSTLLLDV